jgi:hypothetical protein
VISKFADQGENTSLPESASSNIKKLVKSQDKNPKTAIIQEFLSNQLKITKNNENTKIKFQKIIDEVS